MKKFSNFIICLLLCVFAFGVFGCKPNDKGNGFSPKSDDIVVGNGGMVVKKGEYVYFANGFQSVSSLTDDQRDAQFVKGGLYVAKLDETGNFVRDDEGYMTDDYMRVVSDKLAGFDATDLYIFGDYLYFVSPSTENESGKIGKTEWAKDRAVFYRVKLNNFDNVEKLYQSNVKHENLSYQYYNKDGKTYLLVHEKGADLNDGNNSDMLYRIDVQAKKNKVQTVASNVSSFVFGYDSQDNAYDRIYFVENKDSKYSLYRYDVSSNQKTETGIKDSSTEVVAKFVSDRFVFISKKDGDDTFMYRASIGGSFVKMFDCTSDVAGSIYLLPEGENLISVKDNVIQFYLNGDSLVSLNKITDDSDVTAINVIGFANGSIVYYDNSNKLKTVSYSDFIAGRQPKITTIATIEFNKDYLDINGGNLYYCTGDNSGYLFKVCLTNNIDAEGNTESEMVGRYLDEDKPSEDEE